MINYTKEQKEAIEYFDNNLLISASAGSGKTKVLIEKVLKLLKNGVKLNEILMVKNGMKVKRLSFPMYNTRNSVLIKDFLAHSSLFL